MALNVRREMLVSFFEEKYPSCGSFNRNEEGVYLDPFVREWFNIFVEGYNLGEKSAKLKEGN